MHKLAKLRVLYKKLQIYLHGYIRHIRDILQILGPKQLELG